MASAEAFWRRCRACGPGDHREAGAARDVRQGAAPSRPGHPGWTAAVLARTVRWAHSIAPPPYLRSSAHPLACGAHPPTRCVWQPHPFIISLNYAFQDMDHLFLVMDFVGGGDLFALLEQAHPAPGLSSPAVIRPSSARPLWRTLVSHVRCPTPLTAAATSHPGHPCPSPQHTRNVRHASVLLTPPSSLSTPHPSR